MSGYHSLDRKTQLAEFYGSGWQDRAAMALVSPRRIPQPRPSVSGRCSPSFHISHSNCMLSARTRASASLNAGGMSRSLVLLESPSPRPTRRRDSPRSRGRLQLSVASPAKGTHRLLWPNTMDNPLTKIGIWWLCFTSVLKITWQSPNCDIHYETNN